MEDMKLEEFLKLLSNSDGDKTIEIISNFQAGGLTVEGIGVEDFE